MKTSSVVSLGLLLLGATILLLSQMMIHALPEHTTGPMACGVAGFWNVFLDLSSWLLSRGGFVLGGVPLVAGLCGLVASGLPSLPLPILSEGPSNFTLEESDEYLPQEGR